jgi:hypothetical protein
MRLFALLAAVCLSSCVAAHRPSMPATAPFVESEYAPYRVAGTSGFEGEAFARTRAGNVVNAAGLPVRLHPATSIGREWFEISADYCTVAGQWDGRATEFTREVVAGADGHFRFEGLPPGDYYIVSVVTWEVYRPDWVQHMPQESVCGGRFTAKAGEVARIVLPPIQPTPPPSMTNSLPPNQKPPPAPPKPSQNAAP